MKAGKEAPKPVATSRRTNTSQFLSRKSKDLDPREFFFVLQEFQRSRTLRKISLREFQRSGSLSIYFSSGIPKIEILEYIYISVYERSRSLQLAAAI
jgi:hypothetical protein